MTDTENQALAFCDGIGYGTDECAMPNYSPFHSCAPSYALFLEAIELY